MEKLYDRADIYDLLQTAQKDALTKAHWETLLRGKRVQTLLDVSIGSGNLTLPLLELGVALSGSDLSENMLKKCREKAAAKGYPVDLRVCDFREAAKCFRRQFDCVASTGNSLPYVPNSDLPGVLAQMDSLIRPGGYLYLDVRNWDRILRTRQRFYLYNPVFHGDTRINLVQAWDYNSDGTMDFNLLFTFEKENKIVQKELFQEHYYPVSRRFLLEILEKMGYEAPEIYCMPAQCGRFDETLDDWHSDWYALIARKPDCANCR